MTLLVAAENVPGNVVIVKVTPSVTIAWKDTTYINMTLSVHLFAINAVIMTVGRTVISSTVKSVNYKEILRCVKNVTMALVLMVQCVLQIRIIVPEVVRLAAIVLEYALANVMMAGRVTSVKTLA